MTSKELIHQYTQGIRNFREADLREADLSDADLREADLFGANLSNAYLFGANLRGANLSEADLSEANLSNADLFGANLRGANLSGTDLSDADLSEANLSNADLFGANLRGANLEAIRLDLIEQMAKMPDEIAAFLEILRKGEIDGSTYTGECACFAGTFAHLRNTSFEDLPIPIDSTSPREQWFLGIRPGDTPETSQIAQITEGWIVDWLGLAQQS